MTEVIVRMTLTRYAIERLLYRSSQSPHRDAFILKGAALFAVWSQENTDVIYHRTRDVDFLGSGNFSNHAMIEAFREIARTPVEHDGLTFDADSANRRLSGDAVVSRAAPKIPVAAGKAVCRREYSGGALATRTRVDENLTFCKTAI
jgi:hypothetical protein